jgi:hypothetical protein
VEMEQDERAGRRGRGCADNADGCGHAVIRGRGVDAVRGLGMPTQGHMRGEGAAAMRKRASQRRRARPRQRGRPRWGWMQAGRVPARRQVCEEDAGKRRI